MVPSINLAKKQRKLREVPSIEFLHENNTRLGFVEGGTFDQLAAEAGGLWLRTFLELGYTYGWRRGELLGLRARHVNLANRTIRLDPGSTKNGEGREVSMTAKVAELLRQRVAMKKPDDYVLTRGDKDGTQRPVVDMRDAWQNLCVRAGQGAFVCTRCGAVVTKRKPCSQCGSRSWRYRGLIPHELRRSAAKALRRAGVPESVVQKIGGWKTRAMFDRYAIVSGTDQRAAVETLEKARVLENSPAFVHVRIRQLSFVPSPV